MSYSYAIEKPKLFTEQGVEYLTRVRDRVKELIATAGAFRMTHLGVTGDSWTVIAAVDYLVEKGELVKLPRKCWAQFDVYTTPEVHNHG